MKKILFVGFGKEKGLGFSIYHKMNENKYNISYRIGREELYGKKAKDIINHINPEHVIISTIQRNMGKLVNLRYEDIEYTIASKLQSLHRVATLLNNRGVKSVVIIGGALSNMVVENYGAISIAVTAMNMMVDYLTLEIPTTRFNIIEPWKIKDISNENQCYSAAVDDVVSAINLLIETESLNGIRIKIDNGFSINRK
ncbi:hypothetical protein [Klebsiella pneumoniae]